jgi:hypothetical protein
VEFARVYVNHGWQQKRVIGVLGALVFVGGILWGYGTMESRRERELAKADQDGGTAAASADRQTAPDQWEESSLTIDW